MVFNVLICLVTHLNNNQKIKSVISNRITVVSYLINYVEGNVLILARSTWVREVTAVLLKDII